MIFNILIALGTLSFLILATVIGLAVRMEFRMKRARIMVDEKPCKPI